MDVVSDTERTCRRSKNVGDAGATRPLWTGWLETRYSPTCVITPNFIALLRQTVCTKIGVQKFWGRLGNAPLGRERGW